MGNKLSGKPRQLPQRRTWSASNYGSNGSEILPPSVHESRDVVSLSDEDAVHTIKTTEQYESKVGKLAALKPKDYKNVTVKHKTKFEKLFNLWEGIKSGNHGDFKSITEVHGNGVCFQEEFLIGRGSYGTEVYICLGSDGIERAIKRLPKHLCEKFLKNERDLLISRNAVDSPQIVNYWFYDDKTSPDFGYLILNLYEQSLKNISMMKAEQLQKIALGK